MAREELHSLVTEHWDELVEAAEAPPKPSSETWLTRPELADRWKMPPATLDQWGSQGRGPKYARFGRHVRYRLSDVIAWEDEQFKGTT
jgi:predicted DNA-binding transcriptional regulator AlpA